MEKEDKEKRGTVAAETSALNSVVKPTNTSAATKRVLVTRVGSCDSKAKFMAGMQPAVHQNNSNGVGGQAKKITINAINF